MASKVVPQFWVYVKNGVMTFTHPTKFHAYLQMIRGKHTVTIEKPQSIRSLSQNKFYWLYLGLVAEETGDHPNDLHEFFKRKFLPPRFVKVMGQEIKLPNTTTTLSKAQFSDYIMRIEALTGVPAPKIEDLAKLN